MKEIVFIADDWEMAVQWVCIMKKGGFDGFSMIQLEDKWHCMAHQYKNLLTKENLCSI